MNYNSIDYGQMPDDVLINYIFNLLDTKQLDASSSTCKRWYVIGSKDRLWLVIAIREFGPNAVIQKRSAEKALSGKQVYLILKKEDEKRLNEMECEELNRMFAGLQIAHRVAQVHPSFNTELNNLNFKY